MASRQEEKEARRKARMEAEAKEAASASRQKRLQMVFGGVLGLLVIVGAVVAILAATGGKKSMSGGGDAKQVSDVTTNVKLPAQTITDEQAAVDKAGCSLAQHPIEGRSHEDKVFTESDYKTNPPTSGNHFAEWAQDGIYTKDNMPQLGEFVHTLEHGRIDVQYKPGTSQQVINQLEAFLGETKGYHELLFPNQTGMDAEVAATAWGWSLTCPKVDDATWDALRTFRDAHIDRGPEKIP